MSSNKIIVVTGVTTGYDVTTESYELPQRLEWQDFVKDIKNVTLYVRALQELQKKSEDYTDSFFQVGGVFRVYRC